MGRFIYDDELWKIIRDAKTEKAAKKVANKIVKECDTWRNLYKDEGVEEGKRKMQSEFKALLGIEAGDCMLIEAQY